MLKVGLTGGIGCGKTTVATLFAELGVPILDADIVSRELVSPGQPALAEIVQTFGQSILNADGSLNRASLREVVFSDSEQKHKLEAILHPLVYQNIQSQLDQLQTPYSIICIPLLFETRKTDFVDRILVVDCPESVQIARVQKRDQLTAEFVQAIVDSQVSREYRLAHANDLIDNTSLDSRLAEQVKTLHNFYLSIGDRQDNLVCEHQHHL